MQAQLLLSPASHPSLGENINGPSLVRVPDWVPNALGRYYLYFAHHQGSHIRLAYADEVMGPYTVYAPGVMPLVQSGFDTGPLELENIDRPFILNLIEKHGADVILPFFPPHVASPDVHVLDDAREIRMYYHGQVADGRQLTRVATSSDGLSFDVQPGFLGNNYFRVFRHDGAWYALSHEGGTINRSVDGLSFEAGPAIGDKDMRHTALRRTGETSFEVYWSRVGDTPEHILVSTLDVSGDWRAWQIGPSTSVRRPQHDWEGADLPLAASRTGFAMREVNELRDPGIFEENGHTWLLYSVRGEAGIGICELPPQGSPNSPRSG